MPGLDYRWVIMLLFVLCQLGYLLSIILLISISL